MENKQKRTLVIGAGLAGKKVLEALGGFSKDRKIIGFIDDDPKKKGTKFCGLPVLGNRRDIPWLNSRYGFDEVILAIPSAPPGEISNILEICMKTRSKVKIMSGIYDLNTGKINVRPIRDVQIEDLLGRKPLSLDIGGIISYLRDQVVLITGAGGSVGSELSRSVADNKPKKLILLGRGENSIYEIEQSLKISHPRVRIISEIGDIKDAGRMNRLFKKYKPGIVFHAAAHKHVPYMEKNPEEAVKNNIIGTKVLCSAAIAGGCGRFIFISTDKAVEPTSIMGATKRAAEIIVQLMNEKKLTKYACVRFGNILGSRGSVLPLFERQISLGGPLTITHPEMTRYFMTVSEAAQLVIQAGAMTKGGEIFVLDMGEPISIRDLAFKMIGLKDLKPGKDIPIKYIGIRPGEKISESLFNDEERIMPTRHEKIMAVYGRNNYEGIQRLLHTLEDPEFSYAEAQVRKMLSDFLNNLREAK